MLKDEENKEEEATKIGCFFVVKKGRIFARIKNGWGRRKGDINFNLNTVNLDDINTNEYNEFIIDEPKDKEYINEAETAYNKAKDYEAELIKKYTNQQFNDFTDINNFNGYNYLLYGDNLDYITA